MKTKEMIMGIVNLPIDERAKAVDEILKTFNQSDPDIEKAWVEEARRRLDEYEKGGVTPIPGEQVFRDIRKQLSESLSA